MQPRHQYPAALRPQIPDAPHEVVPQAQRIEPRRQHVVHARDQAHDLRAHGEGYGDLATADIPRGRAGGREVREPHLAGRGQARGQRGRPASAGERAVGLRPAVPAHADPVTQPGRDAVAERDKADPVRRGHQAARVAPP